MKLSKAGARLIEEFEGFSAKPYLDAVGVPTIGFGSTKGVTMRSPHVTRAQAEARLIREVDAEYGAAINALAIPTMTQHRFDALVSFVYNCGVGAIGPGTGIGRALRERQWQRAADELLRWDKADGQRLAGLTRRRQAERKLFLHPVKADALAGYRDDEARWIREFDSLRRADPGASRLNVLRAAMTKRRKEIWKVAQQPGGWDRAHRLARYRSLLARTQ